MPSLKNILKVINAFRKLDKPYLLFFSPSYPGRYHSVDDLCLASGLPRSTVNDVLSYLHSLGVVDKKVFSRVSYRLKEWEFEVDGVRIEVELNRVVAYL